MTRTLAHSLNQLANRNKWRFTLWSLYDADTDLIPRYVPAENFKGFDHNLRKFILKTVFGLKKPDIVILSHINLAVIGLLIKVIHPKCKIWLVAHGIEVWRPLSKSKKKLLKRCDKVICVSNFTRQQMIALHQADPARCRVLNNAVDPFMALPADFSKPVYLLKRHWLTPENQVFFTLTRLASTEQYKGHDQVIKAVASLKDKFPNLRYVLAGQYDHSEEIRIQKLISEYKVDQEVILPGFINDDELPDYFRLADLFVLPSKKEGFGIALIEALACGLPVICGNTDGSVDAVRSGELGKGINPDSLAELEEALSDYLTAPMPESKRRDLQERCLFHFNEMDYMKNLKHLIDGE